MALFGGQRDISLFRTLNKELINDLIDTEIYYYQISISEMKSNIYGESSQKQYFNPIKIPAIIEKQNIDQISDEFGQSYTRSLQFRFLKDTLIDVDIVPTVGDIIEWDGEYNMVDSVSINQYFAGKNPQTWDGGSDHGYDLSVICDTHTTRQSALNLVDNRVGNSLQSNENTALG